MAIKFGNIAGQIAISDIVGCGNLHDTLGLKILANKVATNVIKRILDILC